MTAATAAVPDSRYLFNNAARDILAITAAILDGEVAYRQGNVDRVRPPVARHRPR